LINGGTEHQRRDNHLYIRQNTFNEQSYKTHKHSIHSNIIVFTCDKKKEAKDNGITPYNIDISGPLEEYIQVVDGKYELDYKREFSIDKEVFLFIDVNIGLLDTLFLSANITKTPVLPIRIKAIKQIKPSILDSFEFCLHLSLLGENGNPISEGSVFEIEDDSQASRCDLLKSGIGEDIISLYK
jgi:hypothetical protein